MSEWWLVRFAKQRTKEEWENVVMERVTDARIWFQEHGEKGFVLGVLGGILVILAFKLVVFLAVISVIGGLGVWFLADAGPVQLPDDDERNGGRR